MNNTPNQELIVVINHKVNARILHFFPDGNFIGSLLFAKLLDSRLEGSKVLLQATVFGGPLGDSTYYCKTSNVALASKIITELLVQLGMEACSKIYRLDYSEIICRNLFPAQGKDALADDLIVQAQKQCEQTISALERIITP